MGILGWFFGPNPNYGKTSNNLSKPSTFKKISIPVSTINFAKPLPFKTIAQQKAEFVPLYRYETSTERVSVGKYPNLNAPQAQENLSYYLQRGYDVEVQEVTRRGRPYGVYLNFSRTFTTQYQTNTFNPSLTRI